MPCRSTGCAHRRGLLDVGELSVAVVHHNDDLRVLSLDGLHRPLDLIDAAAGRAIAKFKAFLRKAIFAYFCNVYASRCGWTGRHRGRQARPYAREAQRGLQWRASRQASRTEGAAAAPGVGHGGRGAVALTAAWGAARSRRTAAPGPPWSLQHSSKRAAAWQLPPKPPRTA